MHYFLTVYKHVSPKFKTATANVFYVMPDVR